MVDLRATGLSRRSAAEKVSAEREGHPDAETLRKHYRSEERSGKLPPSVPPEERKAEQIADYLKFYQDQEEQAQRERVELEKEAEILGLDLKGQNLRDLFQALDQQRDRLDTIVKQASHWTASYYRQEGITDPAEAKARYLKATEDLRVLEKQVDILRRIRRLPSPDPL